MALRAYLKAGAAFATAGVVAAVPAIAPPLSPHDVKVARDTEVALTANDYVSIVNTFFGKYPGSKDAPGLWGISGVAHQYAKEIAGPVQANQDLVDGFFASGVSEVVRQYMIASTPDPVQQDTINGFFARGITDTAWRHVIASTTDPTLVPFINAFFNINNPLAGADEGGVSGNPSRFGISGVVYTRLLAAYLAGDLTTEQFAVINDLFEGGMTQVVWNQLLARTSDLQQRETINDFFEGGATQVVRTQLLSRTTDPNQIADIKAFMGDPANPDAPYGLSENVRIRLLAATTDPVQKDLINGFFDEGISEVVRYLLVGPAPVPPEPLVQTSFTTLSAPATEEAASPEAEAPKVETLAAKASVPAATPAAAAPAAAPAEAPKFTAKVRDTSVEDEAAAADLTNGNKAEPVIIVGAPGAKSGSGSWGIFGQVADAVSQAISGAGAAPSAGSPSSTPSGGTDSPS
jgi:hypothetical protein